MFSIRQNKKLINAVQYFKLMIIGKACIIKLKKRKQANIKEYCKKKVF